MKKKSKFIVFILSFIPGLSHLYVGFRERAIIFFVMFFGSLFGVMGISVMLSTNSFLPVLGFVLPLIWFIALVDAITLTERIKIRDNASYLSGENTNEAGYSLFTSDNRKLITITLSFIPGAGHMYLGLQRQGLQFMSIFFFAAFLMGWLNMSLFLFCLPVIWFYSLFDAYHRIEEGKEEKWEEDLFFISWLKERPNWVGWGLIFVGCLVVLQRIIAPLIPWEIRQYMQTGLVALILIASGVKLLSGSKKNIGSDKESEKICNKGE